MAAGSTEATITQAITNELAVSNKSTLATNTRQETVYVFNDASGNKNHITVNEKITDANGNETLNKTESSENAPVTMKVTSLMARKLSRKTWPERAERLQYVLITLIIRRKL
ncbi:MAG: hypothetical protein ACLR7D_15985 [Lachnospira eligens]